MRMSQQGLIVTIFGVTIGLFVVVTLVLWYSSRNAKHSSWMKHFMLAYPIIYVAAEK
jgi:hypothetical protein